MTPRGRYNHEDPDGRKLSIDFWDTAGQEQFDRPITLRARSRAVYARHASSIYMRTVVSHECDEMWR